MRCSDRCTIRANRVAASLTLPPHPAPHPTPQAIYALHPKAALKRWLWTLALQEPGVYGGPKVVYVDRVAGLHAYFNGNVRAALPPFVDDYERRKGLLL